MKVKGRFTMGKRSRTVGSGRPVFRTRCSYFKRSSELEFSVDFCGGRKTIGKPVLSKRVQDQLPVNNQNYFAI